MTKFVCPHCGSGVPTTASVCVGCGAEIVRGATRQERSTGGCLVAVVALLAAMSIVGMGTMPGPHDPASFFLFLKFIALVIVANAIGRLIVRLIRRSKVRFLRTYEHD